MVITNRNSGASLFYTWTSNSCIFIMSTVVISYSIMGTVENARLSSKAMNIIQKDRAIAQTKLSIGERNRTCKKLKVVNTYLCLFGA